MACYQHQQHLLPTLTHIGGIYLAPDWSKEERAAYSKLTTDLKQKVIEDAGKYHYIRDEKIVSVDEVQSTAGTLSNQEH